ncbi:hypothetical protein TruAng_011522 [Truncatella angustata]|nr:hypothetical protein TruAng_011522 [Truncatella angustata]
MRKLVVPVRSELPVASFNDIGNKENAWNKIKFEDPNVTDDITTMYQLARSAVDEDIENQIEKELRDRIAEWAGDSYEYRARGTKLHGWTKRLRGVFIVYLPANTLDWVELYTTCNKSYIILESEDDVVGNRQNATMKFFMFCAWTKKVTRATSQDLSGKTQKRETKKELRQVCEVQDGEIVEEI